MWKEFLTGRYLFRVARNFQGVEDLGFSRKGIGACRDKVFVRSLLHWFDYGGYGSPVRVFKSPKFI